MFSQIKDRKHIEQNFPSVVGVMPQGWDLGVRGPKTLTCGFAMAPLLLNILNYFLRWVGRGSNGKCTTFGYQ